MAMTPTVSIPCRMSSRPLRGARSRFMRSRCTRKACCPRVTQPCSAWPTKPAEAFSWPSPRRNYRGLSPKSSRKCAPSIMSPSRRNRTLRGFTRCRSKCALRRNCTSTPAMGTTLWHNKLAYHIVGLAKSRLAIRQPRLQNVTRQVLVFYDVGKRVAHVVRVNDHVLLFHVRGLEADDVEHLLHNRVQAPRANVLRAFIHAEGEVRHLLQRLGSELQPHALSVEQRYVLLGERRLRLAEDPDEVLHRQRLQLHANGEAPLQLGNQVAGLRNMEGASGDEENVIGPHHSVARVHGRAFDDGQDVALHTFARNVRSVSAFAPGYLVDLVEEDDARVLHSLHRDARHLVHVHQALLLFLDEVLEGLADLHLPFLGALAEDVGQDVLHVDVHLLDALVGDDLERGHRFFPDVQLDYALVELAFAQLLTKLLARARARLGGQKRFVADVETDLLLVLCGGTRWNLRRHCRQQQVEQPLFRVHLGLVGDVLQLLFPHHVNGDLHQVTDHGLDIASNVADLGKLRGLDLHKGRVRQLRQPARDLGFADARRTYHDDVLRNHLFGQFGRQFLPAHAITQRDRDRALRLVLAHNIFVEFAHDLARRQLVECDMFFICGCGKINGQCDVPQGLKPQSIVQPVYAGLRAGDTRSQLLNRHSVVGIDADFAGDLHGLFGNLTSRQVRVFAERGRGCRSVRATAADGRNTRVRLDDVSLSTYQERLLLIGDQQERLERAQHFVGAPVLGQLDRSTTEVAMILLQLGLETRKQRERVGGGAGKPRQNFVLIKPPNLTGGVLDDAFPKRDLAVSSHHHFPIPANAKNCSRADQTLS